jgi:hypothetical protein
MHAQSISHTHNLYRQSNTTKHIDLLRSNHESETRIVDALKSTSSSLSSEIQALTAQLDNTSLLSVDDALRDFQVSHKDTLAELSRKLDTILSHQEASSQLVQRLSLQADQDEVAQQRVIDSLTFPQIDERRNKIHRAHRNTYEWVLSPEQSQRQFDDLLTWAKSQDGNQQVYWVHGKPGSGKSTLMRYLFDELDEDLHFHPWSDDGTVLKIDYFFWAPGTPLQKSFNGLLRSLLVQMFSHSPQIIERFVTPAIWNKARLASATDIYWTSSDLVRTLMAILGAEMWYTFFLIDGLDEFEGTDQERDEFLDLIHSISSLAHVKFCVSSRPWNVFRDAFDGFPKLQLEDHTQGDIYCYINQELNAQRRFKQLRQYNPSLAANLINMILNDASGVFLWVRLVVYEMVKALRDGDNIQQLLRRVEIIPKDLDAYFTHLMGSIEPQYHKDASTFIQLALHEEHEFIVLNSLRLLDVVCIQDLEDDSGFERTVANNHLDFSDLPKIEFDIDAAYRRINSRCLGLLECQYDEGSTAEDYQIKLVNDDIPISQIFDWEVNFLHRSFRDFLSLPSSQRWLHECSGKLLDVRVLLCNSRLLQIEALNRSAGNDGLILGLASYVLSAIAVAELRTTEYCKTVASRLKAVLDRVVEENSDLDMDEGVWYICQSLQSYHRYRSSFLTIAIDFNLSAYVNANLTREAIRDKQGRPILNYILVSAFFHDWDMSIGNHFPDLELLQRALELGADPNEIMDFGFPWVSFLEFLYRMTSLPKDDKRLNRMAQEMFLRAVELLLHSGASPVIPAGVSDGDTLCWPKWKWEEYEKVSWCNWERMPSQLVSVADHLALLRSRFSLAAKTLEDCIALASLKLAEKVAANNARLAAGAD